MPNMQDNIIDNIIAAYTHLTRDVTVALRTQLGDARQLEDRIRSCSRFTALINQHHALIPADRFRVFQDSLTAMVQELQRAKTLSLDVPDEPPIEVMRLEHTGKRGRPRYVFQEDVLRAAYEHRGPTALGDFYGVSSRTVRRAAVSAGIVQAGEAVCVESVLEDGTHARVYTSQTGSLSNIEDADLDLLMVDILDRFPASGRRMIGGHLRSIGYHVSRRRIEASRIRVQGAPVAQFGPRRIQRRVYNVPGFNSLWHHDGQHGLIRFKIVVHGFIDGFSRLITGVKAHNNNRAETVLSLFEDCIAEHGLPCHVRGDHGGENVLVAQFMNERRPEVSGPYIWGRSVHNIRIERLWFDFTTNVGSKWKTFFQDLETGAGLDIELASHIWLIHTLFLDALNQDIEEWVQAWNNHRMATPNQGTRSPKEMALFSMLTDGARGLREEQMMPADLESYGVDWEAYGNRRIRDHYLSENPADPFPADPFVRHQPEEYSMVVVDDPRCPFNEEELQYFKYYLTTGLPHDVISSRSMNVRKEVFIYALGALELDGSHNSAPPRTLPLARLPGSANVDAAEMSSTGPTISGAMQSLAQRWPADFYAIDIVAFFDQCTARQYKRYFEQNFPGVPYVYAIVSTNRLRWLAAPESLRNSFLKAGRTEAGKWAEFQKQTR